MALKRSTETLSYSVNPVQGFSPEQREDQTDTSRRNVAMAWKLWTQVRVEPLLVQILVVVANRKVTSFLTDVDKGSM